MRNSIILGSCLVMTFGSTVLFGQGAQRRPGAPQARPPLTRDQREDVRDRREDVRDRREDVRDRREDIRDAQHDGGVRDRREDIRDQREDVRDRREDVRDRREDVRDRLEDRIDRDPELAGRIRHILPPDSDLRNAASGFKNQGQFIAALHVSRNLNIPFRRLKATMLRGDGMSLGQAIHELRPDMSENDLRQATQRAEHEAQETENPVSGN